MNKHGEVIFIDDDPDDHLLFRMAYADLAIQNQLTIHSNGLDAYQYFNNIDKDPFLIISDINMPIMSGIELRDKMQQMGAQRLRTVPFLFLTTGTAIDNPITPYAYSVQGFFQKPDSYGELKDTLKTIFDNWNRNTDLMF